MKTKKQFSLRLLTTFFLVFTFTAAWCLQTPAQKSKANTADERLLPPPDGEQFQKADDLIVPWRSSGCNNNFEFVEPNCHNVTEKEWKNTGVLDLYNEDGSIWYRFSLTYQSPDYFVKNTQMGLVPFATPDGFYGAPQIIILRLVAESSHWYEVEVNENTRARKFVLKKDPLWAKTSWSYWLYKGWRLMLGENHSALRDKPGGEIIEETSNAGIKSAKFLGADGDWAYVEIINNRERYDGWVRWRKGRDILVGCIFNHEKIPEF